MPLNPKREPTTAERAARAARVAGRAVRWGSFVVGLVAGWIITLVTIVVLAL